MDDNPERRMFLERLLSYMEERGTPITTCPTISKNPLDLYKLYMLTKEKGGYLEVSIGIDNSFSDKLAIHISTNTVGSEIQPFKIWKRSKSRLKSRDFKCNVF